MSADYERPVVCLTDSQGRELTVVRHYTDGIVLLDPVKLVVYSSDGRAVAETPYCRDVIVQQTSPSAILAFGLGFSSNLCNRVWAFNGGGFIEQCRFAGRLAALAASFRSRWRGYGIAALCSAYGAITYLAEVKTEGSFLFCPGPWPWFGLASLTVVFGYTPLSVQLVAGLATISTLPLTNNFREAALLAAICGTATAFVSVPTFLGELRGPRNGRFVGR